MPYRTTLVLTSGDRTALEVAVTSLRSIAESKGAEITGPHTKPSQTISVPLFKRLEGSDRFETWEYEVFRRELIVSGHNEVARRLAAESLPESVAVSLTVDQVEAMGSNR